MQQVDPTVWNPVDTKNFDDVGAFHHKFDLHSVTHKGAAPVQVPDDLIRFRLRFLLEELLETADALGYQLLDYDGMPCEAGAELAFVRKTPTAAEIDHAKAFDGLLDLAYVTFGTAHVFGYPWQEGWNEVQRANISKERAVKPEQSARNSTFDVVKPKGWKAPDIAAVLRRFGFNL